MSDEVDVVERTIRTFFGLYEPRKVTGRDTDLTEYDLWVDRGREGKKQRNEFIVEGSGERCEDGRFRSREGDEIKSDYI